MIRHIPDPDHHRVAELPLRPGVHIPPLRGIGSTEPTRRTARPTPPPPPQGWAEVTPGVWELGRSPLARVRVSLAPDGVRVTPEVCAHNEPLDAASAVVRSLAAMVDWIWTGSPAFSGGAA